MKKIAVIVDYNHANKAGSAIVLNEIIKNIKKKHHVSVFSTFNLKKKYQFFSNSNVDFNESKNYIKNIFKKKKYDLCIVFGNPEILAAQDINVPKIAIIDDPYFKIKAYRNRSRSIFFFLCYYVVHIIYSFYFSTKIKKYDYKFIFSNLDKKIFKFFRVQNIEYLHTSVPYIKTFYKKKRKNLTKGINFLLLSYHINQDLAGVRYVAKFIKYMENKNFDINYKFILMMRTDNNCPSDIKKILSNKKKIILTSYNEKIIKKCDFLFYPSNYPVGFRTKIASAGMVGCIPFINKVSAEATNNIINSTNALIFDDIEESVNKLIKLTKNLENFNKLSNNIKKTCKKYYSGKYASNQIGKAIQNTLP